MRIDHIAIYTKKLDRLKSFYEYYFGGISNTKYKNKTTGLETYIISGWQSLRNHDSSCNG